MATLRDVAQLAGVSYQTVSRVLNAPATVLPATRDRVEAAISTLGYYPNAAARRLKLGRSHLLGVVTTDLLGFGPTHTVQAVMDAAEADGWTVLLARFDPDQDWDQVTAASRSSLNALFEHDVELVALVGGTPNVAAAITRLAPQLPVMNIGAPLPGYPTVGVDQQGAVSSLVDHLVGLGHQRIGHLAGPIGSPDAMMREIGWRRAMRDHALQAPPIIRADWTTSGARAAVIAARDLSFSALVCANDQMALGALRALHDLGVRVPDDVSITGFDDTDEAASFIPALTTIEQPFQYVGRRAMELVRALLTGTPPTVELLAANVLIRASTGAVSATHKERRPHGGQGAH